MKVIILNVSKYKDFDAVITAINEEGKVTFKSYGIYRPASKNTCITTPLTYCDVIFTKQHQKYDILKEATLISSPMQDAPTLEYLNAIQTISIVTTFCLQDEEYKMMFPHLNKALTSLKDGSDPYLVTLTYLSILLKLTGYEFDLNHCVRCNGKKSIVGFSFVEGGFVCKNCLEEDDNEIINLTPKQILLLRYLYLFSENFNYEGIEYDNNDSKFLLKLFINYIDDSFGIKLESKIIN